MEEEVNIYKFLDLHFCFDNRKSANIDGTFIPQKDKEILRDLAKETASIAEHPIQKKRSRQWERMNDLCQEKPMAWINEVCWHEMNVDNELTLRCETDFCKEIEMRLRQQLYQWNHMQCDMIIEPLIYAPLAISNTGVGLKKEVEVATTDERSDIISRHFVEQINSEDDIAKLKNPVLTHDELKSKIILEIYEDIFMDIIEVQSRGAPGFWFAPWDDIVEWTGVEQALMDLALRPNYMHALISRLSDIAVDVLNQYQKMDLLSSNNNNTRIGSGAYGYTTDLPNTDNTRFNVSDLWGSAAAQPFSEVSPEMHKEFAIDYEKKWLANFGLNYYGCCEPLHKKIDILSDIPNLRKISISPFVNLEEAAEAVGNKYVFSWKPSPAVFVYNSWDIKTIREYLINSIRVLNKYNCSIEIVLKDISTVQYSPKRLWEWAQVIMEVTNNF
jgi:hypothetical protein